MATGNPAKMAGIFLACLFAVGADTAPLRADESQPLVDEPLAAVDVETRAGLRRLLARHLAERLVRAGALDFTGRERRQLLWQLGDMQWREGELAIPNAEWSQ